MATNLGRLAGSVNVDKRLIMIHLEQWEIISIETDWTSRIPSMRWESEGSCVVDLEEEIEDLFYGLVFPGLGRQAMDCGPLLLLQDRQKSRDVRDQRRLESGRFRTGSHS